MQDFLTQLFDPSGFMPQRYCGAWQPGLVMFHNISDAVTCFSYFAIPIIFVHFLRRRSDIPFRPMFWLFGGFIFACGIAHLLEIVVFYFPIYRLLGVVKLITGVLSMVTAASLFSIIPHALALRGPRKLELELKNRSLADDAARKRARHLEALVELGQCAIAMSDVEVLASQAATLASRGLGVNLCGVFRAFEEPSGLQLIAGVGWRDGLIGTTKVPADIGSLVKCIAEEVGMVAMHDSKEDNQSDSTFLELDEMVGVIEVEIGGTDGSHGVLVAYSKHPQPIVMVAHIPALPFCDDEVSFFRSVTALLGANLRRIHAEQAWITQATTDALTGLRNARYLREESSAIESRLTRAGEVLSVVMIDVDEFKNYNDSFGHPAGDEVLREVGTILRREVRAGDLAARCGGEEFAVLLPGVNASLACGFAERLRLAIVAHPWLLRSVTISLGVSTGGPLPLRVLELIAQADQALYVAKRAGRNRVVHSCASAGEEDPKSLIDPSRVENFLISDAVVLHIDDDESYRLALGRYLVRAGLSVKGAECGAEGLALAMEGPDLILLDIRLPDCNGLDLCRKLKADPRTAEIPILSLSSTLYSEVDRAFALASGASAALMKSSAPEELLAIASTLVRARNGKRDMGKLLQDKVEEMELIYDTTVEGWARALELRDLETEGHSRRVAELTTRIARRMGLDDSALVHVRRGAMLHDIGKVGIPDAILNKPGPLDDEEWLVMRRHPKFALQMLEPIGFLQSALEIPYSHHERWDGGGYPDGLRGEEIPLSARIFAVADIYDALSNDRPYREAWASDRVRDHIQSLSGSHLDPEVTDAFLAVM